ncbi:alpha/beta hydrolase [Dactylosporangium salmoneum]|uniref:Alpha/beta hydrolase n=1 Tax=Dactylosporangium salmoneum TaxID=53361 RepID=A0ABN3FVY0_9ACTN
MDLRQVRTADGRVLEVSVEGPAGGRAFVLHPGTPAGLAERGGIAGPAAERGLRTISYARPGYGGSTPHPGRTVLDAAGDVRAILEHLGHDRFVTAGWSGGGPHALACAAALPGACAAAATLAGVAPFDAEGLDWLAGMGPENVEEFAAAVRGPADLTGFVQARQAELAGVTGGQVAAALGGLIDEVDRAALTGELAESMAASFRHAVSAGVAGWRDDDLAFVRPWGFPVAAVQAPVTVWQGGHDRMVPFAHGQWLARGVPGARARLLAEHGHISLLARFGDILDDLLERAGDW